MNLNVATDARHPLTSPVEQQPAPLQSFWAIYHPNGKLYYTTTHPMDEADIGRHASMGQRVAFIEAPQEFNA